MKKISLLVLFSILLTINLNAQTDEGTYYISLGNAYTPMSGSGFFNLFGGVNGGREWTTGITVDGDDDDDNGNDYWDKDSKERTGNLNLSGEVGYFIKDNLLVGTEIIYGSMTMYSYEETDIMYGDRETESTDKFRYFGLSPFGKYYTTLGDNSVFIGASYAFGTLTGESEYKVDFSDPYYDDYDEDDDLDPVKVRRFILSAGTTFFLNENIALEPSVNYAMNSYIEETEVFDGFDNFGYPQYDDADRITKTNAFYFRVAASIFIN